MGRDPWGGRGRPVRRRRLIPLCRPRPGHVTAGRLCLLRRSQLTPRAPLHSCRGRQGPPRPAPAARTALAATTVARRTSGLRTRSRTARPMNCRPAVKVAEAVRQRHREMSQRSLAWRTSANTPRSQTWTPSLCRWATRTRLAASTTPHPWWLAWKTTWTRAWRALTRPTLASARCPVFPCQWTAPSVPMAPLALAVGITTPPHRTGEARRRR